MNINFQEILKELEFRVPKGIINLNEESQVTTLVQILRENGVSDANEYAQRARVVFSYVNEATKLNEKKSLEKVLSTTFRNPDTGNNIRVASALGYDKKSQAYRIAKGMFNDAGFSDKDIDMVDAGPDDEETPVKKGSKKQEPKKQQPKPTTINVSAAEKRAAEKEKPKKDPAEEDANEAPKYDPNNPLQRAIAEAKTPKELQNGLIKLAASEEDKMFKDKKAGMGGLVASSGESMYCGMSNDLVNDTNDTKNTPLFKKELEKRKKDTKRILDQKSGKEFKKIASELEAISISQKLDLSDPKELQNAIDIYNEREAFVIAYDAEFKKTNVGKDAKFKKEEARHSWISAAYMGSLSLQKNGPANWNRMKNNGVVLKANSTTDGATEELLNNKLKKAIEDKDKNAEEHYKREIKFWNKFKSYHDTYMTYTNDKGYVEIFNISNKKSRDLNDPQNNTTPAKRLKNYMEEAKKRGINPKVVIKLAKAEEKAQKAAADVNAIALDAYNKINKNDIKVLSTIASRLSGRGNIKSKDDATDEYLTALGGDKLVKEKLKQDLLKNKPNATPEQIKKAQSEITSEQTLKYALDVWNDPNTDQSKLSGHFSKLILKMGTLSQSIYDKSKSMDPAQISKSMDGVYSAKEISQILDTKSSLGKTMESLRKTKEIHAAGLNGVHVGFMNDLHEADGTKPGHTGDNGPAVQTYVAGTLSSLHIDTYVENYDDKVLVEMGGVGVKPPDMRKCMAELSGYTGKYNTEKERNQLKEHLIKSVKVDASSGAVYLVNKDNKQIRIASDDWRQAGANTKKVATAYGPELQSCLKEKVKNRK